MTLDLLYITCTEFLVPQHQGIAPGFPRRMTLALGPGNLYPKFTMWVQHSSDYNQPVELQEETLS